MEAYGLVQPWVLRENSNGPTLNASGVKMTWPDAIETHSDIAYSGGDFTVLTPGRYFISSQVMFLNNPNGYRAIYVLVNGVARRGSRETTGEAGGSAIQPAPSVSCTLRLAAGDVISIQAWQNSGGTLGLNSSGTNNYVEITRVGA